MVMNDREPAEEMVTYEEFTTPSGQRAMVKLHDGTTVWLNARSTLRYPNHFAREDFPAFIQGERFKSGFLLKPSGK